MFIEAGYGWCGERTCSTSLLQYDYERMHLNEICAQSPIILLTQWRSLSNPQPSYLKSPPALIAAVIKRYDFYCFSQHLEYLIGWICFLFPLGSSLCFYYCLMASISSSETANCQFCTYTLVFVIRHALVGNVFEIPFIRRFRDWRPPHNI